MATQTTNYGLGKPAWDDMVDVSVLNNNSDIIDAQMKANETSAANAVANMADAYDATATYAEGDYCTYGGKLYQANTDISVAETFDATHWDETTAAEHFSDGGGGGGGGTLIQPVIYSDTEREIGVWRDGKPLYQKTVHTGALSKDTSWHAIAHGISNIDTVVDIFGFMQDDNGDWFNISSYRPDSSNGSVCFIQGTDIIYMQNWNTTLDSYTTIQYTKTIDTPGSGTWTPSGVPAVHYSTDEQVIGTWIDGSTLYQKTVEFQSQIAVSTAWQATGIMISNIQMIVNACGYDKNDKTFYPLNAIIDNGEVKFCTCRPSSSSYILSCTIQYTKTTP